MEKWSEIRNIWWWWKCNSRTSLIGANRGDGVQAVGSINFFDNTQDSNHKHVAIIESDKAGSTANKRGGDLIFYTKDDNVAAPTEKLRISSDGKIGIGDNSPNVQLNVKGSGTSFAGQNTHVKIEDTTSIAANVGGLLAFEGAYDSSNNPAAFAMIHGGKENASNNNYAGYLRFFTRAHGSLPVERMRIRSNGNVVIDDSTGGVIEMTRTSTNTSGMCGKLVFGNTDWDSSIASIQAYQDGDNDSASLRFYTQASGAAEAEQVRITKTGQLNLGGGLGASNSRNFTTSFDMHPICNPAGALFNYHPMVTYT